MGDYLYVRLHLVQNQKTMKICDFVLKNYYQLRLSPSVPTDVKEAGRNPKRVQREVWKQVQNAEIGTKSKNVRRIC